MADLTLVTSTVRGRGFLLNWLHRQLGGFLPAVVGFDDYLVQRVSEATALRPASPEEGFLKLILFLRASGEIDFGAPEAAATELLNFFTYASRFSVTRERLTSLPRLTDQLVAKVDRLFALLDGFRASLKRAGYFLPSLLDNELAEICPRPDEVFVNIPILTPRNERFFDQVSAENRYIDQPIFGEVFIATSPAFDTSLNLARRMGVVPKSANAGLFSFTEVRGRQSIPGYLLSEMSSFVAERGDDDQLLILLLDETLSFYLWETVFRQLGNLVNFALWLPLDTLAPGKQIRSVITASRDNSTPADFAALRASLLCDLRHRADEICREDLEATQSALRFVDTLERCRDELGAEWHRSAEILLRGQKFHLTGDRTAPIQVIGFGDAVGTPFKKGIVLPLNRGVFPRTPYEGPFFNAVHTPEIRRLSFEADDLHLRQFLSFGESVSLVGVYDEGRTMTPGAYFMFLKNEFEQACQSIRTRPRLFSPQAARPEVVVTDAIRAAMRAAVHSYSSLSSLLSCPFQYYYQRVERVSVPQAMDQDDKTGLVLGSFVHEFLAQLAADGDLLARWEGLYDEMWASNSELNALRAAATNKFIVKSYLAEIATHERATRELFIFGDNTVAAETLLETDFGGGARLRIKGVVDRIVEHGGQLQVVDYKYATNPGFIAKALVDTLENTRALDRRFQLLIYAWLLMRERDEPPERVSACFVHLRESAADSRVYRLAEDEIANCEATMGAVADRVEAIIAQDLIAPNYESVGCRHCGLQALCKRDNYYGT